MTDKFICGGSKYRLENRKVIHTEVSFENLPKTIKVNGLTLLIQTEVQFHVSLLYIEKMIEMYDVRIPDFTDRIVNDFCQFTKNKSIDVVRYTDEFRFVQKDGKTTVIVMCEVSNLDTFFDLLNKKYELKIKYPVPHVTLYTLDGKHGTSLRDSDDLENYTKVVENPIGLEL